MPMLHPFVELLRVVKEACNDCLYRCHSRNTRNELNIRALVRDVRKQAFNVAETIAYTVDQLKVLVRR